MSNNNNRPNWKKNNPSYNSPNTGTPLKDHPSLGGDADPNVYREYSPEHPTGKPIGRSTPTSGMDGKGKGKLAPLGKKKK